jgi:multidrug transporter EmrE-like cation transporter
MKLNNMTQQSSQGKKISNYLMLIVLVVLALSVVALFVAVETYFLGDIVAAGIFAGIGAIAMAMCLFLLYQSRRQAAEVKIEIAKVMTTIECQNKGCGNKTIREFQRGDYIFKDVDVACPKCGGKQMITAIYKEVKEKEKTYAV